VSLSAAADELYGADPAGFVARRTELVKQARTAGDKALAGQIAALRRPTVAAWYMNLLARAGSTELDELIDLGATMRQAQGELDMARVTSLAPRRRELEHAVQRLDMLLATQGITASPAAWAEVGHTLTAVAADASAAAAVRSGCLARSLVYAGFGEVDLSDAVGAELEAWVDRRAADRDEGEQPEPAVEPETIAPEAPAVRVVAEPRPAPKPAPKPDPELIAARQRLAEAADEREGAQCEVDEIGLAYAAAQERLRAAQSAVAEAQTALDARQGAGDASPA
jgi:hypothetical protein